MKMKIFTKEDMTPSAKTINMVKQMAYAYRVMKEQGKNESYSVN